MMSMRVARSCGFALSATFLLAGSTSLAQARTLVVHDLLAVSDAGTPRELSDSMRVLDGGCHDISTPEGLEVTLETGFGPLRQYDGVLPVDLGGGRSVWLVQDGFLDWEADGVASNLFEMQYANNIAILFDVDGCAQVLVDGPNVNGRFGFELSPLPDSVKMERYYWPLAAVVEDGRLSVTWAQMLLSSRKPTMFDGIERHPGPTFVAQYDIDTLGRISWERFDDHGFGFGFWAAPGEDGWVYHFGNRNLLNLAMNGGYENGPHPSTLNYVGRGRSLAQGVEEVWDGAEWTSDIQRAAPIHEQGWVASMLRPVRDSDGRWITAIKQEEFWGTELDILVSDHPIGPWRLAAGSSDISSNLTNQMVTYHPAIVAARTCEISVLVSENAAIWDEAIVEPRLYQVFALALETC